jgi:hypothetical protein
LLPLALASPEPPMLTAARSSSSRACWDRADHRGFSALAGAIVSACCWVRIKRIERIKPFHCIPYFVYFVTSSFGIGYSERTKGI